MLSFVDTLQPHSSNFWCSDLILTWPPAVQEMCDLSCGIKHIFMVLCVMYVQSTVGFAEGGGDFSPRCVAPSVISNLRWTDSAAVWTSPQAREAVFESWPVGRPHGERESRKTCPTNTGNGHWRHCSSASVKVRLCCFNYFSQERLWGCY